MPRPFFATFRITVWHWQLKTKTRRRRRLIFQYCFLMGQAAEYRRLVAIRVVDCAVGVAAPAPVQLDSWSVVAQCASGGRVRKYDFNDSVSFSNRPLDCFGKVTTPR
jgi:hypothetical protein